MIRMRNKYARKNNFSCNNKLSRWNKFSLYEISLLDKLFNELNVFVYLIII